MSIYRTLNIYGKQVELSLGNEESEDGNIFDIVTVSPIVKCKRHLVIPSIDHFLIGIKFFDVAKNVELITKDGRKIGDWNNVYYIDFKNPLPLDLEFVSPFILRYEGTPHIKLVFIFLNDYDKKYGNETSIVIDIHDSCPYIFVVLYGILTTLPKHISVENMI